MDNSLAESESTVAEGVDSYRQHNEVFEDIVELRQNFNARLILASLRTEAVRAGMVDLDGLKLIDQSAVQLDDDDKIIDGRTLMNDFRRSKPWLFATMSSSSAATAPASQPARQKTALEMTDQEYAAAKSAVIKHKF